MSQRPRVTVLGSLNTDISLSVPHLPGPGETVLSAEGATVGAGGKGANQAVAAARLGGVVKMAGCLGGDDFGDRLRAAVASEGVDTGGVRAVPGVSSGLALITVDPAGENSIAVAAGANGEVGDAEVAAAFAAECDVLVLSAEVPARALAAALRKARARRVTTLLNLAPVPAAAADLLACGPDWLVVNTQEAAAMAGTTEAGRVTAERVTAERVAAERVAAERVAAGLAAAGGGRHVVITLGAAGAVLATPVTRPGLPTAGEPGTAGPGIARPGTVSTVAVPGFPVNSVDSVGAGDAFVGALAVALAAGLGPADAVRAACAAGAAATTRRGAQAALPSPADILTATGVPWPVMTPHGRPPGPGTATPP
jgi:ribokinase